MTDPKALNDWGFSSGERKLFGGLVSFGGVFLLMLAIPALFPGGSDDNTASQLEPVQEVRVLMNEFAFDPGAFEFAAGDRVTFVIENSGLVPHEFRLTSRAAALEHAEGGHADHDDNAPQPTEDVWVEAAPGEVQTLEVVFDTDTTFDIVACLIPGHYEAGMSVPLTVEGAALQDAAADDAHDEDETAAHDEDQTAAHDENQTATHDEDEPAAHDENQTATHDEDEPAAHDEDETVFDREIVMTMSEFTFEPAAIEVGRGETVRFILDNQGLIQHEFRLSTDHAVEEHLASGHEDHGDETATEGHGHGNVIVLVESGETETVDVTFDEHAEFDVIACLLPGHYEAGMSIALTVTGAV